MTGTLRAFSRVDRVLMLGCVVGAALSASLLLFEPPGFAASPRQGRTIATLTFIDGDARHRPADTLVWDGAHTGLPLLARDAVFVPPGSQAQLEFENGATMEVSSNALIVLEASDEGVTAELKQGVISAVGGRTDMSIKSANGRVELGAGDAAQLQQAEGALTVDVVAGAPALKEGSRARAFAVSLKAPAPYARFFAVRGVARPIAFSLDGEIATVAAIQLAKDSGFHFPRADVVPGEPFTPFSTGTWYWRAVDAEGKAVSSTFVFTVLEDLAPELVAPRRGSYLVGTAGPPTLAWSHRLRARAYEVELSPDGRFEDRVTRVSAKTLSASVAPTLPEGELFWRVRAVDVAREQSPWSATSSFTFSAKRLPKAPVLKDSRMEVERAPSP